MMRTRFSRTEWSFMGHIEVRIIDLEKHDYISRMEVVHVEDGACNIPPLFTIDQDQAQQIMDSLWDCGIRPSEGTGSAGALAAVQRHLEDMRALVFKPSRDENF